MCGDFRTAKARSFTFLLIPATFRPDAARRQCLDRAWQDLYVNAPIDNAPIVNVQFEDMTFDNVSKGSIVKNVQGLKLDNVKLNGKVVDRLADAAKKAGA